MAFELPTALTAALETALNRYLHLDPNAVQRLAVLEGKVIGIVVEDLNLHMYLLPGKDGVQVLGRCEHPADTMLYATPAALWRLARGGDAARMMLRREVRIEGDTQLGQEFRAILERLDIDWEEHLSGLIGDVLAHQLSRGMQAGRRWSTATAESLEQDLSEFLQEEAQLLPAPAQVLSFMDDVDRLRSDVDRLEARLRRLRAHLSSATAADDSGAPL